MHNSEKPRAYSYIRFSHPDQKKGDSLRRQLAAAEKWCVDNKLEFDEALTIKDEGLSAYKGDHKEKGGLGLFLRAVELGKVPKGSYLIVENLDRLSREQLRKSRRTFEDLLEAGINIVTLDDGRTYTDASLDSVIDLMVSMMILFRAHNESETKANRIAQKWGQKKELARTEKLAISRRCPKWMEMTGKDDYAKYVPIPHRVAIVQEIFQRCIKGEGTGLIARELNKRGEPVWGVGKESKTGKSKHWHASYIHKILSDGAAMGRYQPMSYAGGIVEKDGEAIEDYYPPAVSKEVFFKAKAKRRANAVAPPGRAPRRVSNLFPTRTLLCKGHTHKEPIYWTFRNKAKKDTKSELQQYIGCSAYEAGACEVNLRWPYKEFERIFLEFITQIDLSAAFEEKNEDKFRELMMRKGTLAEQVADLEKRLGRVTEFIEFGDEDVEDLLKRRRELVAERNKFKAELEEVTQEAKRIETHEAEREADVEHLKSLVADLKNEDSRYRLKAQIKDRIERIEIYAVDRPSGIYEASTDKKAIEAYMLKYEERFEVWFRGGDMRRVTLYPVQPNKYLRKKAGEVRAQRWGMFRVFQWDGAEWRHESEYDTKMNELGARTEELDQRLRDRGIDEGEPRDWPEP